MFGASGHRLCHRVVTVALLAGMVFALTGCFRYTVDGEIHRDGTLSGTFVFALKQENAVKLYGAEQTFLNLLRTGLENSTGAGGPEGLVPGKPSKGKVELRVYRSGDLVGYEQRFTGIPIGDLNPKTLTIRHRDSRFIVDINVDFLDPNALKQDSRPERTSPAPSKDTTELQRDLENRLRGEGVDPDLVLGKGSPDLQVRLRFPGEIISANGTVSGRTVTWRLVLGKQKSLHASAWDKPERSWWWVYLIVVVVAAWPTYLVLRWLGRRLRGWWLRRRERRPGRLPPEPEKIDLGFEGLPALGEPDEGEPAPPDEGAGKRSQRGDE